VVFIRRLTASSCSSSGTTSTCGSDTIHEFTADGTFTA
jgi:positive regulator of sigma E activity